jgi:hypothetical protein
MACQTIRTIGIGMAMPLTDLKISYTISNEYKFWRIIIRISSVVVIWSCAILTTDHFGT